MTDTRLTGVTAVGVDYLHDTSTQTSSVVKSSHLVQFDECESTCRGTLAGRAGPGMLGERMPTGEEGPEQQNLECNAESSPMGLAARKSTGCTQSTSRDLSVCACTVRSD